jgi:transcriptional regulator with XRE-family HTH domain
MDLSKSLRLALADSNMQKKVFAEKVGTSQQQVSNWLRTGNIKQSSLSCIASVFDMSVSEFIALGEG